MFSEAGAGWNLYIVPDNLFYSFSSSILQDLGVNFPLVILGTGFSDKLRLATLASEMSDVKMKG
jgi:hypothetical protein